MFAHVSITKRWICTGICVEGNVRTHNDVNVKHASCLAHGIMQQHLCIKWNPITPPESYMTCALAICAAEAMQRRKNDRVMRQRFCQMSILRSLTTVVRAKTCRMTSCCSKIQLIAKELHQLLHVQVIKLEEWFARDCPDAKGGITTPKRTALFLGVFLVGVGETSVDHEANVSPLMLLLAKS